MNLFSAITSWLSAYNALSGTQMGHDLINKWKQAIAPVTKPIEQAITPAIDTAKSVISPFAKVASDIAQPVVQWINYNNKVSEVKKPYQEQLTKLGITAQHLDDMGLSDEEKQAVKDLYSQVGVEIPWLAESQKPQDTLKNANNRTWLLENIGGSIQDVVGGAISEVPKVAGETLWFLSKASQYNPLNLWLTAIESWLTDKTYWQLRDEQIAEANKISDLWQKWKEFVQKYGAYDPNTISSKVWETATDIWSATIWPNKLAPFAKWVLWTAWNLALEGGLAGAKYGVATEWKVTPKDVAWGALWNTLIGWAFKVWWNIAKSLTPKTAEEKILESVWWNISEWIVNGKNVKVPTPQEGIITKISTPLRQSDPKVLTGRALTPSYVGKTPKQMLKSVWDMTENVKDFYTQVRTGKMKWDISTLEDSANTVIKNLDSIGSNIGEAVKWAKWTVWPSVWTMEEISNTLWNKIESRSGAFNPLKNFLEDTKDWLSLQDAFKAKKVYQSEITKLIKSGDAWTDSYQSLVKWVQELSDNIDNVVEKSIWSKQFAEWKKQYRLLKSIASDISKSAVVEWRKAPQTFVEQLWTLQAISDGITNPLSTAKSIFAKEIGELNTRWWAWKELIKNYDKEAIKTFQTKTKKIKVWS